MTMMLQQDTDTCIVFVCLCSDHYA